MKALNRNKMAAIDPVCGMQIEPETKSTFFVSMLGHVYYFCTESHPTSLALIGAGISIAFKEALYHYTVHTGRRIKSQLIVANAWHHRSDAFSSVAVLLGVAGTLINPSCTYSTPLPLF